MMRLVSRGAAFLCAVWSLAAAPDPHNWTGWGNGPAYDRFAPAGQINTANVSQLKPIWKYVLDQKGGWEITPIVVNGVMYLHGQCRKVQSPANVPRRPSLFRRSRCR